jgi:hypothetical protein
MIMSKNRQAQGGRTSQEMFQSSTGASSSTGTHKEFEQIIAAANFLKSNWKTALPTIAIMGASAYLFSKRNKRSPVVGKTVKTKSKQTGKKQKQ